MTRSWRRRWQRKIVSYASIPVVAGMVVLSSVNPAWANPAGGVVANGTGTITNAGSTTTITQTSNKLGINWNSFSVGAGEKVQFIQPSANAIALNRVTGNSASNIYGSLQANGQVFLVNPNGVLFAPGAQVNVAGLVASTKNITDKNFESGKYSFSGNSSVGVINQGNIATANGGYVALLGSQVRNEGVIVAQRGSVALAGGETMTLDLSGTGLVSLAVDKAAVDAQVVNKNLIQADGGTVVLTTSAANALAGTVVNNSGIIRARSLTNEGGIVRLDAGAGQATHIGSIDVSGNSAGGTAKVLGGNVTIIGKIDASGSTAGGTVLIGGNYQGKGVEKNATIATVEQGATIAANATETGNGGKVIVWADNKTTFQGNISALGGKTAGNGGTVEVSGKKTLAYKGTVDLRAQNGKTGTLLLDPSDFTIAASGGDLTGAALGTQLENANVTILSSDGSKGTGGDVVVNDSVSWTSGNQLDLSAYRNVVVNKAITAGNNANANIRADNEGTGTGTVSFAGAGSVTVKGTGVSSIIYNPTNYTTPVDFGSNGTGYMLVNTAANLQNISTNPAGKYVLGKNIAAGGISFVPIANFSGVFDGNNQIIDGLKIAKTGDVGLFKEVLETGIVKNVTLANVNISATAAVNSTVNVGSVAGSNAGKISNVQVTGTITGTGTVTSTVNLGGLAAQNSGQILDSNNAAVLTSSFTESYDGSAGGAATLGGLTAQNSGSIENSYNTGSVTANGGGGGTTPETSAAFTGGAGGAAYAGGIAGTNSSTGSIKNTYNFATVKSSGGSGGAGKSFSSGGSTGGDGGNGGTAYAAGLAAQNSGSIENSYNTGSITAAGGSGGSPGFSHSTGIYGTNGAGGHSYSGGIAGANTGPVSNSYNEGIITSNGGSIGGSPVNSYAAGSAFGGGLFGSNSGIIDKSYNIGNISVTGGYGGSWDGRSGIGGKVYAGGIAGSNSSSSVNKVYSTGAIIAVGLSGSSAGGTVYAGGLMGSNGGNITNAYSTGSVTGTGGYAAWTGTGGSVFAGGLVGYNGGNITNAYSTGASAGTAGRSGHSEGVNGQVYVGGLVGYKTAAGTAINSYWDKETSTLAASPGGGAGLTTVEMKTKASFSGWDFSRVWKMGESGYPEFFTKILLIIQAADAEMVYNGGNFSSYSASYSGFEDGDTDASLPGTLSYSGTAINAKNVGHYTITPGGLGESDKYEYQYVDGNLTINPKALTATLAGTVEKTYDGTTAAQLASGNYSLTGVVAGDTVTLNAPSSGVYNSKNAGSGKNVTVSGLSLAGASAGNYVLSSDTATSGVGKINPAQLTATLAGTVEKTYDGTTAAQLASGNYSLTGVVAGDTVTATGTGAYADKNAGAGKTVSVAGTTLGGGDAGNYVLSAQPAPAAIGTINPASVVVTASPETKTYDGTVASTATPTITGLMSGDAINATQAYADKNAGTGKILSVTGYTIIDGNGGGNYTVTTGSVNTGVIDKRSLTVTAAVADKIYDGTTAAVITGVNLENIVVGESLTTSHGGGQFADKNAGVGKTVVVSGLTMTAGAGTDANNYSLPATASSTATITPASLVVTASADTKTYDGTVASTAAPTVTGLVAGDTATATQTFASKNAGSGIVLTPTATITDGNGGANYVVTANPATGTINPKAISAALTGTVEKTYDGTTSAQLASGNYSLTGVIAGDTVTTTGTGAYSDKNAGAGKTVSVAGTALGGGDAGNYVLSAQPAPAAIGKITPASLVVTASPDTKTYDGTTASTAAPTVTGLVAGDTATATQAFASKNAGSGIVLTPTATITDSNGGANYVVTANTNTGAISQRVLSILATAADKTYDGTTAATISGVTVGNVVAGESVSATYSGGAFADKNAGANKAVTISGLAISASAGTDANNYSLPATVNSTATITPASLVVTASADTKTYDGTVASTAAPTVTGLVAGDTATATQTFASKNAGSGIVLTPTATITDGNGGANYVVTANPATGTINPKAISAALTGTVEKTYDGTTSAQLASGNYSLTGVIAGDTVTATGTGAYSDKNAGAGKTVSVAGTTLGGPDGGNYVLSAQPAPAAIGKITSASLVVTAKDYQKYYDNTPFAGGNGITINGLLAGDVLEGTLTYLGSSQGATEIGTYTIAPGGYSSQNYNIVYRSGTLNINKVPVSEAAISSVVSSAQTTSTQPADKQEKDSVTVNNSSQIDAATASSGAIFLTIEGTGVNLGVIPTLTMPLNQVSVVQ